MTAAMVCGSAADNSVLDYYTQMSPLLMAGAQIQRG